MLNQNNLREKAYQHIRRRVFNGEFPPGTRLVNRTLATEIGSSFIPVREALSRLASEGLVQQVAGAGSFVRSLSRQEISEIYDVRELIEPFAASAAARLMTDHELNELQALLRDWEKLAKAILKRKRGASIMDLDRWLDLNERFHTVMIAASRNRFLAKIMSDVHLLSLCFTAQRGSPKLLSEELVRSTIKSHGYLLQSLEKHDSESAEEVVHAQLRSGREMVLNFFDTQRKQSSGN
ncbi:MAG: GntR family transcriptional regulator [Verrucomicrobia bacterium]|nr:GntR family transcriptional regulator [Verrucomicrobiota bacterium]